MLFQDDFKSLIILVELGYVRIRRAFSLVSVVSVWFIAVLSMVRCAAPSLLTSPFRQFLMGSESLVEDSCQFLQQGSDLSILGGLIVDEACVLVSCTLWFLYGAAVVHEANLSTFSYQGAISLNSKIQHSLLKYRTLR